jgi:uncharacterized phage protein gp47/JayE
MTDFQIPSFLQNHSTEENHEKMRAVLPADIDLSEGGHAWNMTRPTALLAAELYEFILPQVIQFILPEYSSGDVLHGHARQRNITQRGATPATGEITITGDAKTIIPAGSLFYTASVNEAPSVEYETTAEAIISDAGSATVEIRCTKAGVVGNTAENTIVFAPAKITGIKSVTNEKEITGGTEAESEESIIARILEYDQTQGDNFVGSYSDYKRWAMSVDGVGNVAVIPAQDDSGLVTLVISDSNGDPATEQLLDKVYNYIMGPDDPEKRLAPINALLSVLAPATMTIAIKATVALKEDATTESAKLSFISKLTEYLPVAMEEKEIKYTKIFSALSAADGVSDFSGLLIGVKGGSFGTSNIKIETMSLPEISADDIEFTVEA